MKQDDFAERAVLALERIADLVELILGVASGAIEIIPDEDDTLPEHGTQQ